MNEFSKFVTAEEDKSLQHKPENEFGQFVTENPDVRVTPGPYQGQRQLMTDVWEGVKNVPEDLVRLGKTIGGIALDIPGTARAAGDTAMGAAQKLARNLPGVPEDAPKGDKEVAAEAAWKAGYTDRWSTPEKIRRTLIDEPVMSALDVGGVGGAVLKPLRAIEPMTAASRGLDKLVTKGSKSIYGDAMGIERSMEPGRRAELIDRGMDTTGQGFKGIDASPEGLARLETPQAAISAKLDEVISNSVASGDRIQISEINQHLDDLMRSYENTIGGNQKIAKIKEAKAAVAQEFPYRVEGKPVVYGPNDTPILRTSLTPAEMQKVKTKLYEDVYDVKADTLAKKDSSTLTMEEQARGAKESIEQRVPEISALNEDWGKLAELKPYVRNAMDTFQQSDPGLVPYISKKMRDPGWRSKMAIAMRKLADGDIAAMEKIPGINSADIRVAMVMAGRNREVLEEDTIRTGVAQ